jgi:hypothetical protein
MGEEGSSKPGNPNGPAPVSGAPTKGAHDASAHYEVGPGFEIAIRSGADRPLEVTLKGERGGEHPPKKRADAGERKDTVERRLDAIERSILLLAQHMQELDERLSRGPPPDPQRKP